LFKFACELNPAYKLIKPATFKRRINRHFASIRDIAGNTDSENGAVAVGAREDSLSGACAMDIVANTSDVGAVAVGASEASSSGAYAVDILANASDVGSVEGPSVESATASKRKVQVKPSTRKLKVQVKSSATRRTACDGCYAEHRGCPRPNNENCNFYVSPPPPPTPEELRVAAAAAKVAASKARADFFK
jgi:hypothetical protein